MQGLVQGFFVQSSHALLQDLEGALCDPGFCRNRMRDSGIRNKSSRDSGTLYWLLCGVCLSAVCDFHQRNSVRIF